jgi:Mg-chelatase subunit ChlD
MSLLSWKTGLIFASIAVPLLLLLYFLKLRRQERKISSTLLWKRAVHDLRVNAPFQKLRKSLLLFLQLLVLGAILFAIANPVANFMRKPEENIVLLVDRSASMKTVEEDGRPRLEHAKDAAIGRINNLPDNSRAMVIGFADRANVVCSFTDDKRRLKRLIEEIEATDAPTKIGEALQLAVAYTTNLVDMPGVGVPKGIVQSRADIELFSDGRLADAQEEFVTRGEMRYYRIGAAKDNIGIVAFGVRRDYERPGMLSVFAKVQNFGAEQVKLDVSLTLSGERLPGPGSVQEITLGPAASPAASRPADGARPPESADSTSSQEIVFSLFHEAGGIVQVNLHHDDALSVDNAVSAPIDPPRKVRGLVVSDRERVRELLLRGLAAIGVEEVTTLTSAEYEGAKDADLTQEGRSAYDLVLFDKHDTNRLPPGNYLFFGGLPKIEGVARGEDIEGQLLVLWQENHPLARWVPFEKVFVSRWPRLALPSYAVRLVEGEDSVVMAFLADPGHRYIISAFDLVESNFLWEPAFAIFLQNAVMYLSGTGLLDTSHLIAPGETLAIGVPPGADKVRITRPNGSNENLDVRDRHTVIYARTHDAGMYEAKFDDPAGTKEAFAANLLDSTESFVAPVEKLTLGSQEVVSVSGETKVNEPLWPWLALAALVVVLIEWWVYNRRVMV